jgi:hypothetical protein
MAINPMGTLPPELYEEQQALNRQQRMAQALLQQGMQQPQGQMVSGRYVPTSFFQNIAPLVQSYVGTKLAEKGDKQAIELAKKLREGQGEAVANYIGQLQGRPAIPERVTEMAGPYGQGVGESGANIPMPTATIPARPAIQANPLLANMNVLQDPYAPDFLKQQAMTQLTRGPKWKEVTEFNPKTGNTETYRYDEHSPNPRDTLQFIAINKPAISPETQVRFADEGISIPQQFRGGAVSAGQPQGGSQSQPNVMPTAVPTAAPAGAPTVASSQGYDYFKAPPPPAGLTGKQAREFVSEQNKPLTGKPAEQVTGAVNYQKSLDKVQNLLDTYKGPQLLDPNVRAQFKAAIRTAQLQGKEAFGLGVLNGPDLDILEQVISDPTAFDAFLKDRSTINKLYNNQREFTSEAIKTNYRASQKSVPSNLRQYVEIRPKELTPDAKDGKPKAQVVIQRAILNNEPIETRNGKWVYSKTGKAVE